jgi:hypothetical protein
MAASLSVVNRNRATRHRRYCVGFLGCRGVGKKDGDAVTPDLTAAISVSGSLAAIVIIMWLVRVWIEHNNMKKGG